MEKKIVNKYYLADLFGAISYYDLDDVEELFWDFDDQNEEKTKLLIRFTLQVHYLLRPIEYRTIFKQSLKYALTTNELDYEEIYNLNMPSLQLSIDYRVFFVWIWEVFYGSENYDSGVLPLGEYKIENNQSHLFHLLASMN